MEPTPAPTAPAPPVGALQADRPQPENRHEHGGGYALRMANDGQSEAAAYLHAVIKRRWLVLATFAALALPGAILSFTGPDIYQARARIVIEQQTPELSAIRPGARVSDSDDLQTHAAELRSRAVARRAVEQLQVWREPAFEADNRPASWLGFLRALRPPAAAPSGPVPAANRADQPGLVAAFLGHVAIETVPLSRLIDVKYTSSDPRFSAAAANALARGYVEHDLESRLQSAKTTATWLDGQLAEQRKRVSDSLAQLQEYREAQNVPSLDERQQNVVSQKLADLNAAVTRAKTERIARETTYNQLLAIQRGKGALDTLPVVLSSAFIQQQKSQLAALQQEATRLSEQYGDKHPEMVRVNSAIQVVQARLQVEVDKIVQSVRNEYLAAESNERSLSVAYEQQKVEAMSLSRKSVDYSALQREAQSNQQVYDGLLQEAKQAGMAGELHRSTIRITDPADIPLAPIGPRRTQNLLLAVLGAAACAVGLALGLDFLAHQITSPDEIERYLDVPFFGFVPVTRQAKGADGVRPLFIDDGSPAFSEAFRRIRTNVMLQTAPSGHHILMVTSTGPSEGKTLVAANLSVALAKAGQGVVVIDGDMRRPRLSELFGKKPERGLSNVLAGQCKVKDAITETSTHGLRLMASGECPENPAELLASPRLPLLLESLREAFQWVIIDTPPVLAVADAVLIASQARHVLFVVSADKTARAAAQAALGELRRVSADILGGVLNRVNLRRDSGYYSRYYRKEYGSYYHETATARGPARAYYPLPDRSEPGSTPAT